MARAAKVCSIPTCPETQPCPRHPKVAWAGSTRRKRLPKGWDKTRRFILQRDPVCKVCDNALSVEVDHIKPNDDHRPANLQGICSQCHKDKTQAEARRARKGLRLAVRIFALVGLPASGKSTIRKQLAEEFDVNTLTIDEHADWSDLLDHLEGMKGTVVVESNIAPSRYRVLLGAVPSSVVEITAPTDVRAKRLRERGLTDLDNHLTPHPLAFKNVPTANGYEEVRERFLALQGQSPTMNELIRN